jgi:ribosomal protein L5
MFVGTPGHTAALLWQQIAARLNLGKRAALLQLLSGAKNETRRNKEKQQDRSFRLRAEHAIGSQAAVIQRLCWRH